MGYYATSFRYEEEEAQAIKEIISYLEANAPGSHPRTSDAIRYALIIAAADIRMEKEAQK